MITTDNGYYEIGIYEGWFNIGVYKDGFFGYYEEIDIPENQTIWMNIILEEIPPTNSTVCGFVNGSNGELIEGAEVWLHDLNRDTYANGTWTNDNQ